MPNDPRPEWRRRANAGTLTEAEVTAAVAHLREGRMAARPVPKVKKPRKPTKKQLACEHAWELATNLCLKCKATAEQLEFYREPKAG